MPLEKPGSALVVSLLKFLSVESASLSGGVAGGSLSSNHICGVAGSVGKGRQEEKGKPASQFPFQDPGSGIGCLPLRGVAGSESKGRVESASENACFLSN